MEKEIITIIVVGILVSFILTIILTLIAIHKADLHFIYVHTKTGNRYRIIQECKMKYDDKWMDAIAYVSEKDDEMYVREYNDFTLNFKRLSEWENQKQMIE